MTRRPSGVPRHWFFHLDRGYRREHLRCCIDTNWCPVCSALDSNCDDLCGCYANDADAWREALWARQAAANPELALIEEHPGRRPLGHD